LGLIDAGIGHLRASTPADGGQPMIAGSVRDLSARVLIWKQLLLPVTGPSAP
jgi:hypothetical protein